MKILVTGSNGQLGHALSQTKTTHTVIPQTHADCDITNTEQIKSALKNHAPDVVINTAAFTQVDKAESEPKAAHLLNAVAPGLLAKETAQANIPLVHISTDYVFKGDGNQPLDEKAPTNPQSVYGKTKLEGEKAVMQHNSLHFVVRTAWLYHTQGQNFPKTMMALAKKGGLRVVNDQFGSPTYAPHLAAALLKLVETQNYGLYHLAGAGATTWFELTKELFGYLGTNVSLTAVTTEAFPRPAPRPAYAVLISSRTPKITLPPWREGLKEFSCSFDEHR